MRTDLDHLPDAKRRQLDLVVQILFEEFRDATALAQQPWKKQARILKIILFGSYARGDWMDEPHTVKGYQSDFDMLIIVNHEKLIDRATYWSKADERLMRERTITGSLRTPVNFDVRARHDRRLRPEGRRRPENWARNEAASGCLAAARPWLFLPDRKADTSLCRRG